MQDTLSPPVGQVENRLDIAGFAAWNDPYKWANCPYTRSRDELDHANLTKLWQTGLDVSSLNDAHERYRLSPLRVISDLWKLLGYAESPLNPNGTPRFADKDLTSLAIPYPNPQTPGELYPFNDFIRVRYPAIVRGYVRSEKNYVDQKYGQPTRFRTAAASEPYFLPVKDQWARLFNPELPLIITEGELKAVALALAGTAGIGFPGITMWTAGSKAGKGKLHPALDPQGPRQRWAIPIVGRTVVIIPDADFRSNKLVRDSVDRMGKALLDAGAGDVFLVQIPAPNTADGWKGVDDYLTAKLGEKWGGDAGKVAKAGELIEELIRFHSRRGNRTDWNHPATSPDRTALRMERLYREPQRYTAALVVDGPEGPTVINWLTYHDDTYRPIDVYRTVGNTSGKVVVNTDFILRHTMEEWEVGIKVAREEGDLDGKVPGMPADFANRTLALLAQHLDRRKDESLIEPFENVRDGDTCLRIRHALINLNRCFESGVSWDQRIEWLLPPDYRWFGGGQVGVSLSNLPSEPTCPRFLELIRNAFDDDVDRIKCMQLWFGKIVCSPMFAGTQQFLALYGAAGGGKSTLYRLFLRLLGDGSVAELRANFGGRFDTAHLPGKKLVVFEETPDGVTGKFDPYMGDVIKQITGQDRVICEAKGQKGVPHRIDAEVLTIGNSPPVVPMNEDAFRRRAVFLKVSKAIAHRDHTVEGHMMKHELPGILLWALRGAAKLYAGERIATPHASLEDLEDATTSVSPEERFVNEMLTLKPKGEVTPSELREAFISWAAEHHMRVQDVNQKKIGYLIREKFKIASVPKHRGGKVQRVYTGIGLTSPLY